MNVNRKCLNILMSLANYLGVIPVNVGFKEDYSWFISKMTLKHIIARTLMAIFTVILHVKVRIYDRVILKTNFTNALYIGCSTATLTLALCIVITRIAFYGKTVIKLAYFFTDKSSVVETEKAYGVTKSRLYIIEIGYISVIVISITALDYLDYAGIFYIAHLWIDLYTEMITHIWVICYFNLFRKLEKAFKDLYLASLTDLLNAEDMNKLWKRYLYLRGIAVKINKSQGLNAVFLVGFVYIWQLSNAYVVFQLLKEDTPDITKIVNIVFFIVIQGVKLFILVHQAPKCMKYVQRFRIRMCNYSSEENHVEEVNDMSKTITSNFCQY